MIKISTRLIIITIVLIAGFAACTTVKEVPVAVKKRVLPLGDSVKLNEGSLIYSLPMTALNFTVVAERTTLKAGPYHDYADQFLGLRDVIESDQVLWRLKEVEINPVIEIDPSQFYVIESDGLLEINAIAMKRSGLILDINPDLYSGRRYYRGSFNDETERFVIRDMGSNEYYNIEQDTTFRVVDVDTAFVRIPYVLERRRQLTLEQQAENTARILLELREGRHMILTGETNVFPQDEAAVDEINRLEDEYITLFAGKSYTERRTFNFFFVPEKDMEGRPVIIFRFSPSAGVLDAGDVSGRPVVLELMSAGKVSDIHMVEKDITGGGTFDKLFYRIPEVVNIRVTDGRVTLGNTRQLIYQFGPVVALPANYIIGK